MIIVPYTPASAPLAPSAAVITPAAIGPAALGELTLAGVQNGTVVGVLGSYYESYGNSRILVCNSTVLPLESSESAGASMTALKLFQGAVSDTSGSWSVKTSSTYDTSYNATGAAIITGHQTITRNPAITLPMGSTSVTVTPPDGCKSLVFVVLQWGAFDKTAITAPGVSPAADNRSTYTGVYTFVVTAPTELSISPAIRTGRSIGLLQQIDVY